MRKLFEMPELLTIDGTAFTGEFSTEGDPNSCGKGCDAGCHNGGCFPGSSSDDDF